MNDLEELGLDYCVAGECSSGTAVENPDANPGLLTDCDALLASRDKLRGTGFLNWSAEVAIGEWFGVTVEGSPKRVTKLEIGPSRLNGESRLNLAVSKAERTVALRQSIERRDTVRTWRAYKSQRAVAV